MRSTVVGTCAAVGFATVALAAAFWPHDPDRPARPRAPVLAELFTSEGCSSCPPADQLLERLHDDQPVADAEIVVLSEHVDYWDRLGWKDPFSSGAFTRRQDDYARTVFGSGRIYTPQLVVDGRLEAVGNDLPAVRRIISDAARAEKARMSVRTSEDASRPGTITIDVRVDSLPSQSGAADLVFVVAEDDLVTHVRRGENANRRLRHVGVVRRMDVVSQVRPGGLPLDTRERIEIEADWKASDLRAIAFLQQRSDRRIVGVAATRLIPG